jgi:3-oxoacyl-[acyl-carrier protein] reductase
MSGPQPAQPAARVMLLTGSSRGIGRFLAEHYLARGWLVEGASRGEAEWTAAGYRHHRLDVSDEARVREMFSDIRRRHGGLEAAINNAGAASLNHVLLTPGDTARRILAANFQGTFLVSREAAKLMKAAGRGRIVNFSTVAVPLALEGEAVYAAAKSAVETFTRILARELAPFGITCNAVGPSPVRTDLLRGVPEEKIQAIVERLACKRLGSFADVANVVDFFLKPESDYLTGQILYLGGIG